MNKTERLKALQAEYAAKFQAIVDEPETPACPAGSLLPAAASGIFNLDGCLDQGYFKQIQQRDAYAAAFDTLIELRRQPGTEKPKFDTQLIIKNVENDINVWEYYRTQSKRDFLSPCFATREHAQAAIEKIGADRLKQMFNTLHGVE